MLESPFGPDTQKYWDKRHQYFSLFDQGIKLDREGLYSIMPEKEGLEIAHLAKGKIILDAFCGVGGSAIQFARSGFTVVTVDIHLPRIEMAQHNSGIYNVSDKITFINESIKKFLSREHGYKFDCIFLDPPWGGPDYYLRDSLYFEDFIIETYSMFDLVKLSGAKHTIMRVPRNFDFKRLSHERPDIKIHHFFYDDGKPYFSCLIMEAEDE